MFANQVKDTLDFANEVSVPASVLHKKFAFGKPELVQSASTQEKSSSRDMHDSVWSPSS